MKTVIIYSSNHHENTLKLATAISEKYGVNLINADTAVDYSLNEYDCIGFAAGIAYGSMYKRISEIIKEKLPECKKVFFLYTCGKNTKDFSIMEQELAKEKNCTVLGSYGCPGYDTYGPLKLIGGINKGHPDDKDIQGAVHFFEKLEL